jgi:ATP-binding cassette subfamily C protein LapB
VHTAQLVVRRHLDHLPAELLPAIVLLKGDRAALLQVQADGRLLVQYPESEGAVLVEREVLQAQYAGVMCFVRPQFRLEKRSIQAGTERAAATGSGP